VLLLGGLWGWVLFNRLWQGGLVQDGAAVFAELEARGWRRADPSLRARVVTTGQVSGKRARVEARGGLRGSRWRVQVGGRGRTLPLGTSPDELQAVLDELAAS